MSEKEGLKVKSGSNDIANVEARSPRERGMSRTGEREGSPGKCHQPRQPPPVEILRVGSFPSKEMT